MEKVRSQYEKFPYPPVSSLAQPVARQAKKLSLERCVEFAAKVDCELNQVSHPRILVAGCGTLEAMLVAQAHPYAKEIVAIDISHASISRLKRRLWLARVMDVLYGRFLFSRALPPIRLVQADLLRFNDGPFDVIYASNVLHHLEKPAEGLACLSAMLKPGGMMRVMTYAKQSRFWIAQVARWLRCHGLTRNSASISLKAQNIINELPEQHLIRQCFEHHSEHVTETGIVDAFLHACDNPQSPICWQQAAIEAGLTMVGEMQREDSSSAWLARLCPETEILSNWQRLQLIDNLLLQKTNPIFWFVKTDPVNSVKTIVSEQQAEVRRTSLYEINHLFENNNVEISIPSDIYFNLGRALREADQVLERVGLTVEEVLRKAARDRSEDSILLSYDLDALRHAAEPLPVELLRSIEAAFPGRSFYYEGCEAEGMSLTDQLDYLQCRYGMSQAYINCEFR